MSKYVAVAGTSESSKARGGIYFASTDIVYNMRLAKRKGDKVTYIRMLRLRAHVNSAIRMSDAVGQPHVTIRREQWKTGEKYVVRNLSGQFKAVI